MSQSEYRAFRAQAIASEAVQERIQKVWAKTSSEIEPSAYRPLPPQGLAYGRQVIEAFRDYALLVLKRETADRKMAPAVEAEFARRALRVPNDAVPDFRCSTRIVYSVMRTFAPVFWWQRIAMQLRMIGTPQGRRWVFSTYVASPWGNRPYFDDAFDFFVRHFTLPKSKELLDRIGHISERTVRIARRLGLSTAEALAAFADASRGLDGGKLAVLTELGVIRTTEELTWLEPWRREREFAMATPATSYQVKRSIARLLDAGVPRDRTVKVLEFWHRCARKDLDRSLSALTARGYENRAEIFDALGETLWRAHKASNWNFVIDVVGARELEQLSLFRRFLEEEKLPDAAVVHALRAHGASIDDLAKVQSFVLTVCDRRAEPIRVINLLLGEPHSLPIAQLAQCRSYAAHRSEDELVQFLTVLAQYGFGSPTGLLAFTEVYASSVRISSIARLLRLYLSLRDAQIAPSAAAKWVIDLGENNLDSLEYLAGSLSVTNRTGFQQIRPFGRIAKHVLSWAVEGHGCTSIEALRTWRRRARGIELVDNHDWREPVTRILLEDAANRGDFVHVNRNWSAFWRARSDECQAIVGWPVVGSERAEYDQYWLLAGELKGRLENRALPHLPRQLEVTGGILAGSLIRAAWRDLSAFERGLNAFNDEVSELLEGRGPSTTEISDLQADAISAVYGVDLEPGAAHWNSVVGFEGHLKGLTLRAYEMRFARRPIQLKPNRTIDVQGIEALRGAIDYARSFREHIATQADNVLEGLSPKQMRDNHRASSPQTLLQHLGVLLGVLPASTSETLSRQIETLGLDTQDPEQRHEAAARISSFFRVDLLDALPLHIEGLAAKLAESVQTKLARRLFDPRSEKPDAATTARDELSLALDRTANRVREVYGRWVHRQLAAFTGGTLASNEGAFRGVVSKHGAAYFAKVATKICTGDNVRMWQEARQSHLLVFDVARKRLVAMAMLYIQRIPAIDDARPTLVMRAINTIADEDSGHDAGSIVSAFLSVGEQITKDNNFAALAVPINTDQHLLSNRDDIAARIERRCGGMDTEELIGGSLQHTAHARAVRLRPDELFYGYEHGRAPVDVLYVLWERPHEAGSQHVYARD